MKRRTLELLVLTILLAATAACAGEVTTSSESAGDATLIIANGTVIDGTGGDPILDGIVVLRDNLITAVGEASEISLPAGIPTVDAQGGTIMPGVIDAHVHSTGDPAVRRKFLLDGVTAVCNLGSTLDEMPAFKEESDGQNPVARGFQAGPIMTAPGGAPDVTLHIDYNYEVATPEEARAGVVDILDRGADLIKLYFEAEANGEAIPMLDAERARAIVEEAHARGLLARAHVTDISLLDMALSAGVDTVEHVPWLSLTESDEVVLMTADDLDQGFSIILAAAGYDTLLSRMAGADIVMVPTLDRVAGSAYRNPNPTPAEEAALAAYLGIVRQFHDLGGRVALGTDFNPGIGMDHGMPVGELEMLLAAGLSPAEVLQAATHHAAYACGQGDRLGALEPGKLADVIVVNGDPLADIGAMSDVTAVIKDGQIVDPS
jgi:imidazolonepropionase-like amidohydrolase